MNTKSKRNIRNPEKWIGKYVRHMANWRDMEWPNYDGKYFVCEWTGELYHIEEACAPRYEEELVTAEANGYDECYYYCGEAIDHFLGLS